MAHQQARRAAFGSPPATSNDLSSNGYRDPGSTSSLELRTPGRKCTKQWPRSKNFLSSFILFKQATIPFHSLLLLSFTPGVSIPSPRAIYGPKGASMVPVLNSSSLTTTPFWLSHQIYLGGGNCDLLGLFSFKLFLFVFSYFTCVRLLCVKRAAERKHEQSGGLESVETLLSSTLPPTPNVKGGRTCSLRHQGVRGQPLQGVFISIIKAPG